MSDPQMKIVNWQAVEAEIQRSRAEKDGKRIHWERYFGKSLNKAVAELEEQGNDKQAIFKKLSDFLASKGIDDKEFYRKLHIGVSSRTSEGESRDKMRRHVRHRTMHICKNCKGTGRI